MYEISDYAESPDVEYPALPPLKHHFNSLSQYNTNVAGSSASYASLSLNGKVRTNDYIYAACFTLSFMSPTTTGGEGIMLSGCPSVFPWLTRISL